MFKLELLVETMQTSLHSFTTLLECLFSILDFFRLWSDIVRLVSIEGWINEGAKAKKSASNEDYLLERGEICRVWRNGEILVNMWRFRTNRHTIIVAGRQAGWQGAAEAATAEKVCRRLERHREANNKRRTSRFSHAHRCCRSGGKRWNMSLRNSIGLSIVIFLVLLTNEKCHSANTDDLSAQSERDVGKLHDDHLALLTIDNCISVGITFSTALTMSAQHPIYRTALLKWISWEMQNISTYSLRRSCSLNPCFVHGARTLN